MTLVYRSLREFREKKVKKKRLSWGVLGNTYIFGSNIHVLVFTGSYSFIKLDFKDLNKIKS